MQGAEPELSEGQPGTGIVDPKDPFETGFLVDLPVDIIIERISMVSEIKS